MLIRPRRNRTSVGIRSLVRETTVSAQHLVLPLFVQEGEGETPIASMPGCARLGINKLIIVARTAYELGVPAVALFPRLDDTLKTPRGEESVNANGLLQRAVIALKKALPGLIVITDVALAFIQRIQKRCAHRNESKPDLDVWFSRCICAITCLYQFYEPEHSTQRKARA